MLKLQKEQQVYHQDAERQFLARLLMDKLLHFLDDF
jgi:hypothetical protein